MSRGSRRWIWIVGIAVCVTNGLVHLALLSPAGKAMVMPGPLTSAHGTFGQDCENCHVGEEGRIKPIGHGLFVSAAALDESRLCLECHQELGEQPLLAHSTDTVSLESEGGPARTDAGEVPCATCHREHRGRDATMTGISDAGCQSCHTVQCESFESDHPELENYPQFASRIAFNHQEHLDQHFAKSELELECRSCHETDLEGGFMLTASFADGCMSCHHHAEQIRGKGRTIAGVSFLTIPAIDLEALEDLGHALGDWPADAEDFDGEATPFLWLLLSADPAYADFVTDRHLLVDLDLTDLVDIEETTCDAVARFAEATTRLLREVAREGTSALRRRYARLLERDRMDPAVVFLAEAVPQAEWNRLLLEWFPTVVEELAESSKATTVASDLLVSRSTGDWHRSDDRMSLEYLPREHRDRHLQTWLDLATGHAAESELWRDLRQSLDADGRCTKCHRTEDGKVHWRGFRVPSGERFTKFAHAPHLTLSKSLDCVDCHPIEGDSFPALERSACAECHNRQSGADRCTLCHSYHISNPPR